MYRLYVTCSEMIGAGKHCFIRIHGKLCWNKLAINASAFQNTFLFLKFFKRDCAFFVQWQLPGQVLDERLAHLNAAEEAIGKQLSTF